MLEGVKYIIDRCRTRFSERSISDRQLRVAFHSFSAAFVRSQLSAPDSIDCLIPVVAHYLNTGTVRYSDEEINDGIDQLWMIAISAASVQIAQYAAHSISFNPDIYPCEL